MNIGTALFFLLILACPLMMIFRMRGHGHGGATHEHDASAASVDELRQRRDELDREIAARDHGDRYDSRDASSPVPSSTDTGCEAQETHHGRASARR
jgi:hypothetical protein